MTKILLAAVLLPGLALAHEYGPDAFYTGAPMDPNPMACASATCHTSIPAGGPINAFSSGAVIATFSNGSSYTPGGQPITITVRVVDPQNVRFGFQMTARPKSDPVNSQAGSFTPGPNQIVICENNNPRIKSCPAAAPIEFIEHAYPAGTTNGISTTPYTFTWMPPASNVGPVVFYVAGNAVNADNKADGNDHVYTASYTLTPVLCSSTTPVISNVISAGSYGALADFASGSWIEIYGSNIASDTWQWGGIDFNGANAPTTLAGVSVSINDKPAYVYYFNTGQIDVQAPADTSTGPAKITVSSCGNTSVPFTLQKDATAPGLLAPRGFFINGKQYLVAIFQDGAYAGNANLIPGLNMRPAKPGDVITFYGIGFGDAKKNADGSSISPGVVVTDLNTLANPLEVRFGSADATISYQGLAGGFVGLYQFNVAVPDVPDGDVPITVTLNGTALPQKTYLTVQH